MATRAGAGSRPRPGPFRGTAPLADWAVRSTRIDVQGLLFERITPQSTLTWSTPNMVRGPRFCESLSSIRAPSSGREGCRTDRSRRQAPSVLAKEVSRHLPPTPIGWIPTVLSTQTGWVEVAVCFAPAPASATAFALLPLLACLSLSRLSFRFLFRFAASQAVPVADEVRVHACDAGWSG